ncbi:MAG: lipopolysaccharide transport periplasmic protein LptA [Desulfobacteraceae bacterium]|nr:MAG: lipopolysaccharide transport periplasmic protein LptA [Desulfobacteraceae bacterium]
MNKTGKWVLSAILAGMLGVPVFHPPTWGAGEKPLGGSKHPVVVTADTLDADNKAKIATFSGTVVAKQLQEKETLFIYSDKLIVYYADDTEKKPAAASKSEKKEGLSQQSKIDKIIATGQVKIVQGEDVATGENATFFNAEQKIVLTGNPKVWQGKNLVKGEEITVWIRENRSQVTSKGSNRVQAVIHQEEKK